MLVAGGWQLHYFSGPGATIERIQLFGGVVDNPEDIVEKTSETQVTFHTRTSGDFDGADIFSGFGLPRMISVTGSLGGYIKVGNVLAGNPYKPQPQFNLALTATADDAQFESKEISITGGVDLFVSAETLPDVDPRNVEGTFTVPARAQKAGDQKSVYFVGRKHVGGKVITSPVFVEFVA
ncbi:hypothetical protein P171DRAFT_474389 [Karstenula rhodostoma CBS 690.94]|uniref:Uncharacterized protein n=1 Tax=Karstenula rhodostoma CBS 690.94 TaxID=1392251 RepID=A0A9P4PDQ0_9PLEO|nr:hypothetical protein P171DRAFT_474389 [Karstenula rhodostoma CBS 690.94]